MMLHNSTGYIYIYAFSRRFYAKRLTVHSGYTCIVSMSLEHRLLEIISGQLVPELYYLWLGDFMLECGRIEKKNFLKS